MILFPVIERDLRATARRPSTYSMRFLTGLTAVSFGLGMLLAGFFQVLNPNSAGRSFFLWLALTGYVFALLDGVLSTCDCISRERREGTLGLLFLTRLNGLDVVFGKYIPRLLRLLYLLLAALPSLAMAFLLGGVTRWDFFRIALALANAVFYFTALGILISTFTVKERFTFTLAFGVALVFGVAPPACAFLWQWLAGAAALPSAFLWFSPAGALVPVLDPKSIAAGEGVFAASLVLAHLMGWLFLAISCLALPRLIRDAEEGGWFERLCVRSIRMRGAPARTAKRQNERQEGWWEVNPVFAKIVWFGRRASSPDWRFSLLSGCVMVLLLGYPQGWLVPSGSTGGGGFPPGWFTPPVMPMAVLLLHLLLRYTVAVEACHALAAERRSRTLELLLTTPLGEEQIIRGQLLGLKRRFTVPVLLVLGVQSVLLVTGLAQLRPGEQFLLTVIFLLTAIWLLADLYVLSWTGFWCGLQTSHTSHAIRKTLSLTLALPWMLVLGSWTLAALLHYLGNAQDGPVILGVVLSVGAVLANYIGCVCWAVYSLGEKFREAAGEPMAASESK